MADLPVVNALEELKTDGAKQRKALQDSLGRRFRILSSEIGNLGSVLTSTFDAQNQQFIDSVTTLNNQVENLSNALASSFNIQNESAQTNSELLTRLSYSLDSQSDIAEQQLAFQQQQATDAEFRDAENLAELRRLAQQREQQPQQNNQKDDEKKSKGIFGKLLSGIGSIVGGLGFGGLLAGAGILMAGGGFLLSELNDLDGEAIRANVKELLGIKDDFDGMGNFFLEGGLFGLSLAGIGTGLAFLGAGSAIAGLGSAIANFTNPNWAKDIVDNVTTLLSIPDRVDFGSLGVLFKGAAFGLSMLGIGTGLAFFGAGAGIAGLGQGLANFTDANWAQSIVDNVATLLSISQIPEIQNAGFLGTGFAGIMLELATGLAVFGAGSAIAGIGTLISDAEDIRNSVAVLLSISQIPEVQNAGFLGTGFAGVMAEIGAGLAVFGAGNIIAGIGQLNRADAIKKQVSALLSITDVAGPETESKATSLVTTLGKISAGLVAFTATKVFDSLASIGTGLINFFTGNEAPMTQVLKFAENEQKLESASNSLVRLTDALEKMSGLNRIGIDFDIEDFSEELEDAVDNVADIDEATYDVFAKRMAQLREAITPTQVLQGAEVDVRSRENASNLSQPNVTVSAPSAQVDNSTTSSVNSTTVAPPSPRRGRTEQYQDFRDPLWVG
jgi:hypothetical protein